MKEVKFFRLFETYTAFQEVAMYYGGLAMPQEVIPEIPDKVMVGAKGFDDKWSFRKEPGKKKRKRKKMSGDQKRLFGEDPEQWDSIKAKAKSAGEKRRGHAQKQYVEAAAHARQCGFELIQHSEAHYKVKTQFYLLEVYPGNQRFWHNPDRPAPILKWKLPDPWTLLDVVKAIAVDLESKPPADQFLMTPLEEGPDLGSEMEEFKHASILASQYGFFLTKRHGVYCARMNLQQFHNKGWEIEIDLRSRTITRVDGKGPHPDVPQDWTLMDVVEAIHARLEAHGHQPRPKER